MRSIIRYSIAAGALALPALPAGAQERSRLDDAVASRIDTTVALDRNGTVDLSLVSGEIVVSAGSGNSVRVRAFSERGILQFSASPQRVSLQVRSERRSMGDTRYEVSVPVGTRLVLRAVSGDVTAKGVKGELEASSVSGDVDVADGAGDVDLETVSGDLTAERLSGRIVATSVSGDVSLNDVNGELEVETVSGEMRLSAIRSKVLRTETVSGELTYDGTLDADGRYDFRSHSGDLRLGVPANAGGTVRLETFSGAVESVFPMTMQPNGGGSSRPKRLEFTFGNGGARITAETFSGDIIIERATNRSAP